MNFGQAIEALKEGQAVARSGWNGKKMFIYLNKGSIPIEDIEAGGTVLGLTDGVHPSLFDRGGADTVTRLPNLNMRAASGATVTGWLASQTDILAEDWTIVDL